MHPPALPAAKWQRALEQLHGPTPARAQFLYARRPFRVWRMRKHQVALTLAPDGSGGYAAILHVRSTGPRKVAAPVAVSELWELAS